ncbi:MAG: hypothetical protein WC412_02250, partial [Candidatus Omnitrophota bacterium]
QYSASPDSGGGEIIDNRNINTWAGDSSTTTAATASTPKTTTQYTSPAGPMAPAGYQPQQAQKVYTSSTGNPLIDSFNQFQNYKNTPIGANTPIVYNPGNAGTAPQALALTPRQTQALLPSTKIVVTAADIDKFNAQLEKPSSLDPTTTWIAKQNKQFEDNLISAANKRIETQIKNQLDTQWQNRNVGRINLAQAAQQAKPEPIKIVNAPVIAAPKLDIAKAAAPVKMPAPLEIAKAPNLVPLAKPVAPAVLQPKAIQPAVAPLIQKNPIQLPKLDIKPNTTIKPITPALITPYKNNLLPNYSTAVRPYNPGFTKVGQFAPISTQAISIKPQLMQLNTIKPLNSYLDTKVTQMPQALTIPKFIPADFNGVKKLDILKIKQPEPIKINLGQSGLAFNKDLKPVFLPIKSPIAASITQPVLIKPQWVKLDNNFTQTIKPVLPKLEAISALKQPAALKPMLNPLTSTMPVKMPLDTKLTKIPAPVFMPIQKPAAIGFNSLKPNFTAIKQPEPIKTALGKLNPYFIKEQAVLSPIKPNFAPIAQDLTIIKPQIAKLAQFNQPIKPEFMKITQASPTLTQPVLIKPNFISMGEIKPLNISLDKNMTRIPEIIATPKFIPVDFSAVKKPILTTMKQPEPINIALGQLNPALNKDLKPVFSPAKNPTTIFITRPTPIKPQWVMTSPLNQPIPEVTKIERVTPTLTQLVPIKPENVIFDTPKLIKPNLEAITIPKPIPLVTLAIEKPETVAIKAAPIAKIDINDTPVTFEKIKPQEETFLEFQKLITPVPLSTQVITPQALPQALENPINKSANIVMTGNKILETLKPNLVDNYIQQLKTVYEWQKMSRELAYLSRNAEVILENGASVELTSINEKIIKTKAELDRRAPGVKDILAKNLVEPTILKSNVNNIQIGNFPVKEVPINNELPQRLPIDRNLPLNPPALLPQTLPKPEGGFMPGLRMMLGGNVFAHTNDRYADLIDYDLKNAAQLRNQPY